MTIKLCCSLESVKASFLMPLVLREHGFVCFPLTVFSIPKDCAFVLEVGDYVFGVKGFEPF